MNSDFRDLLSVFNANRVEYLIVGAYALAAHGRVRATGDIDIWVKAAPENAPRVIKALTEFGAPLHDLNENDLTHPGLVFQIGIAPLRIDILTHIDGVEFDDAWAARLNIQFADQPVAVLSQAHLIQNKKTVGRAQDLADVEWLEHPDRDDG
jgi:hypothetical protein